MLEKTEIGESDQHFYEEDIIVLITYQDKCFTFLDVNLVLYVQNDFIIPLHLHSHGKKDVFGGLIVKYSAVSMDGLKIHSRMLCGTTKETRYNIYLNKEK